MTPRRTVLLFTRGEVGRHLAPAASADCVREVKGVITTNPTWKPPLQPGVRQDRTFPTCTVHLCRNSGGLRAHLYKLRARSNLTAAQPIFSPNLTAPRTRARVRVYHGCHNQLLKAFFS